MCVIKASVACTCQKYLGRTVEFRFVLMSGIGVGQTAVYKDAL